MLLGFFLEVRDGDSGGKNGVVGMFGGHCGGSFSSKVVQLNSRNSRVQTIDDFKGNRSLHTNVKCNGGFRINIIKTKSEVPHLLKAVKSKINIIFM